MHYLSSVYSVAIPLHVSGLLLVQHQEVTMYICSNWYMLYFRPAKRYIQYMCGPGSSDGIATGYGLGGPGIESRWGARFSAPVQPGPGTHPASCTMGTGSFPGVKRPGRDADHPPPPSAEFENQYSYTSTPPLGPSWPVIG
jgi:hypothetical protein